MSNTPSGTKLINVRSPFKSRLENIERIYAKNGMVYIELKDGQTRRKKVSKAAQEAYVILGMLKTARKHQPHLVAHHEELLDKLTSSILEAKKQIQDGDEGAITLQRFMKGQTPDGKDNSEVSEDSNIEHLMFKYPSFKDTEVSAILRQAPSYEMADHILNQEHSRRVSTGEWSEI